MDGIINIEKPLLWMAVALGVIVGLALIGLIADFATKARGFITHVTVREYEAALLYEDGRFLRSLAPGRHRAVNLPWARQEVIKVDRRRTALALSGQEMLTADALSVRLNVAAEFRVVNAREAVHGAPNYQAALYTALQLRLREEVQARTLDALLTDRAALSQAIMDRVRPEAEALGLELVLVGVRDIILPGEVKRMLAQEIEAQRAGRAALIAAREETAATRAKANTAQILSNNPVLLRLREIEALAQVAGGEGNTVVLTLPNEVLGALGGARNTEQRT
jgi:regulator of protease activity HflC (stomatin/prohibitin superfamily)